MTWEYRVAALAISDVDSSQMALNNMGQQGWELVTVLPNVTGKDSSWAAAIYKRQAPRPVPSN